MKSISISARAPEGSLHSGQRPPYPSKRILFLSLFYISLCVLLLKANVAEAQLRYAQTTGARSLAMAGATLTSGSDVISSIANPATLSRMKRPHFQIEGCGEFFNASSTIPNESIWAFGNNIQGLSMLTLGGSSRLLDGRVLALGVAMRRDIRSVPRRYPLDYNDGMIVSSATLAKEMGKGWYVGVSAEYWWRSRDEDIRSDYFMPGYYYDRLTIVSRYRGLSWRMGVQWEAESTPHRFALTIRPRFDLNEEGTATGVVPYSPPDTPWGTTREYSYNRTIEMPWDVSLGWGWQAGDRLNVELLAGIQFLRESKVTTKLDSTSISYPALEKSANLVRGAISAEYDIPVENGRMLFRAGAGLMMTDYFDWRSKPNAQDEKGDNLWSPTISCGFGLELPLFLLDLGYSYAWVTSSFFERDGSLGMKDRYQLGQFYTTLTVPFGGGAR